jgi:phosphohistidine phosphatase
MTHTLILTRHAKSSWDNLELEDHDRPLNPRGIRSAKALGDWLRNQGLNPDQVLSSSARRTGDTYLGMGLDTTPEFTSALYHAGPDRMLAVLKQATGKCVLILGHNPGIADFAARLVKTAPAHPRFFDYPSGATLVLRFDVQSWSDLRWSNGSVVDFTIPRDLMSD